MDGFVDSGGEFAERTETIRIAEFYFEFSVEGPLVAELKNNEITRKRLAKFMALYCFRNIHMLEELHGAGQITQEEMTARCLKNSDDGQ